MSATRSLYWATAMKEIQADRAKRPAGLLAAQGLIRATSAKRRPLVVAGAYDKAAIMAAAVAAARVHQGRTGSTWGEALSVTLKATWQLAKAARTARAH
ncbi:hypothetical protein [Methylobacterium ajmalii]|jgi:hypothetical protein|uniref:hypothetical protein n=1 Tax=Methylobacterium ajmalii TaxID=2738439 RepID=UPI00190A7105|nr:hypothetical protein [Methylobacterium ajmalii]MBK3400057.1 hypothetical protein [Methylobacterium ajmalii]MBK3411352.1 hypothetical protein [Methylobacterium ajmalii]MBK3426716.1 hypothetical protein [Methylobacterium ajmalii]